jgi:hypothetical protein
MRWQAKKLSEYGDCRIRRVFAWTPTKVNGYIVWLEFYYICEEYIGIGREYNGVYWKEQHRYF